ncbi:hypothetical protein I4I73_03335 [Pseudonocardia sp. KRD-184]|uniref:HNH endonuclease n=1 Tax=Pseudonocardia oceani TaxID=2792013 RepID=A0ABS6UK43_9PSEU|nr:hypothetical protein [Pseudonocardia oceani]MBW0088248.1 hypothetical protein [Pseudonocardia oceani]MBW0095030.1 hypothetical protein [Pseudonocardia oceani]MBW0121117.1 hypothetical protein [Pseudonocardia oceani]MBW0131197.1 hypothetical protein [Pseudonocardia oceani]MBW0132636.1 hypothetical protein [Pseudonocardia oceani]
MKVGSPARARVGGRAWRVDRARFLASTHERDCWLCRRPVDRDLPGTHPWGPTADHEVPLMLGGPELVRDGAVLHLAHNRCNAGRSNTLRAKLAAGQRPARDFRTSQQW